MGRTLSELRPVYVVGIGLHPYRDPSNSPYIELGLTAVRQALGDAAIAWESVDAVYTATAVLGVAASRPMLRFLGATGIPMVQVENASASGSSALRMAALDVASGTSDVALALGIDQPNARPLASNGLVGLADGLPPVAHFAVIADLYLDRHGLEPADIARVAVKNLANAAGNENAQRREALTLEQVLAAPAIAGTLTKSQCCPFGEGAAAVLLASEDAVNRLGIPRERAVSILSSVAASERVYERGEIGDVALTRDTTRRALAEAGVRASDLDVVEVHDAFSIEEPLYLEAIGVCEAGEAPRLLAEGAFNIGGQVAVSPSGGLLAMGHPFGPTGIGQIVEITRQLRGEAGARQHPGAHTALAHMVGVGSVCVVHVLQGQS